MLASLLTGYAYELGRRALSISYQHKILVRAKYWCANATDAPRFHHEILWRLWLAPPSLRLVWSL